MPPSLDPSDWEEFRAQSHEMLDGMLSWMATLKDRPVWQPIPHAQRAIFTQPLPTTPTPLIDIHQVFVDHIRPYAIGNAHPGFMGWVQGGGTAVGAMAEMLAAGLNANVGGRDQIPVEVEWQILRWVRTLFRFPEDASGLFVTGTSMANFIAVLVARTAASGITIRDKGLVASGERLVAYTSQAAHGCVAQAMDLAGLGRKALRVIPTNTLHQIDHNILRQEITKDRRLGLRPFLIIGTAGSVDVGAIDDLNALATIAHDENLWFHIDGAYAALGMLSPQIAPLLNGIERADSIAFDFHKWAQVPYDAGFILIRDGKLHHDTFAAPAPYLYRAEEGMAAGSPWPCDFGPDLSRGFRALKTWFTLQVYGTDQLGEVMWRTCKLAQYLVDQIKNISQLELLAPVALNIVCFRFVCDDSDAVNARIVVALQCAGLVAPSSTTINGSVAIRAALFNHRTGHEEIDLLVKQVVSIGTTLINGTTTTYGNRA